MRADLLMQALRQRQEAMQRDVFDKPPADYQAFVKQLGIWRGIGDAMNIIRDMGKKELE